MKLIPIVLSRGLETPLWSLSRKDYSKQSLPLLNVKILLQEFFFRFKDD